MKVDMGLRTVSTGDQAEGCGNWSWTEAGRVDRWTGVGPGEHLQMRRRWYVQPVLMWAALTA